MAATIEAIVNQALMGARRIRRVADIFEGSEESIIALELYSQARDELLALRDWSFSRRVAPLTLLKGPPPPGGFTFVNPWSNLYPYPGFLYEYAYPADCLQIRAITAPPGLMPDLDPVPSLWRVDNDPTPIVSGNPPVASGPQAKVIYCNVTNAIGTYRAQITDPGVFDTGFTGSLVEKLTKRFAEAFGDGATAEREDRVEAEELAANASSLRG